MISSDLLQTLHHWHVVDIGWQLDALLLARDRWPGCQDTGNTNASAFREVWKSWLSIIDAKRSSVPHCVVRHGAKCDWIKTRISEIRIVCCSSWLRFDSTHPAAALECYRIFKGTGTAPNQQWTNMYRFMWMHISLCTVSHSAPLSFSTSFCIRRYG